MSLFKRIKTAWKLSKIPEIQEAEKIYAVKNDTFTVPTLENILGDGKAEWLGEGTQEEYAEFEREEKGLKGIFGIGKK